MQEKEGLKSKGEKNQDNITTTLTCPFRFPYSFCRTSTRASPSSEQLINLLTPRSMLPQVSVVCIIIQYDPDRCGGTHLNPNTQEA